MKKTIKVEEVLQFANEQLAHPNNTTEEKLGIITMIHFVHHKANRYNGFMFLNLVDDKAPELGTHEWCCRKYF